VDLLTTALPFGLQRVAEVARAMASAPDLLLLDEPAAGLNSGEKRTLHDLLDRIAAQGLTILIIDHDMTLIAGVAKHLTVLNFGRRIADGETAEVLRQPDVVAAYLGAS
jgi:branched-chain amino acid transport system permease protein